MVCKNANEHFRSLNSSLDFIANSLRFRLLTAVALEAKFRQKLLYLVNELFVFLEKLWLQMLSSHELRS